MAQTKTIQQSIDVDVAVSTAYNQWTQFEDFPLFMEGVRSVRQLDDRRLVWATEIAGQEREWHAEITEQIPDRRIAWRAVGEVGNAGVVTFHRLDDIRCRVALQIEVDADRVVDKLANAVGATDLQVRGDLERFKTFIETRGKETGAWRGTIGTSDEVEGPGPVGSDVVRERSRHGGAPGL